MVKTIIKKKTGESVKPAKKSTKKAVTKKKKPVEKKRDQKRITRVDSTQEMVRIYASSAREILPPENITLLDRDYPFFDSVIAEFAKSEWTDHMLELAAMLAKNMSDHEYESNLMRAEGSVRTTEKGHMIPNPRKPMIQMHASNIYSLRRTLQLHAHAQARDARDTTKRRAKAREIENNALLTADDDLIPKQFMN